jgi:phenylpyruvate tautomerase PptA (4-oxalocrotonate tautomerase family)
MPLVKVNLLKGRSAEEKGSIAASIQTALVRFGKGLAQRAPTSQWAG